MRETDRLGAARCRRRGTPPVALQGTPHRMTLCFQRTPLGDQQVRRSETRLPLHIARLLLLFEGPQTVEDLRQMIDEPWLPEALIELERRRLIQRVTPPPDHRSPAATCCPRRSSLRQGTAAMRRSETASAAAACQSGVMFLRQLGSLGSDMARRIDECRSEAELNELMPQVDALIEATGRPRGARPVPAAVHPVQLSPDPARRPTRPDVSGYADAASPAARRRSGPDASDGRDPGRPRRGVLAVDASGSAADLREDRRSA